MQTETTPSVEQVRTMKLPELMTLGESLGIPYDGEGKKDFAEKIAQVIEARQDDPTTEFKTELKSAIESIITNDGATIEQIRESQDEYRNHDLIVALFEKHLNREESSLDSDTLEAAYDNVLSSFGNDAKGGKKGKNGKGKTPKAEKTQKEKAPKEPKAPRVTTVELNQEMKDCLADETMSKSDKIRKLFRLGLTVGQIAKETKSHYSFTHGVVKRFKEAQNRPANAAGQGTPAGAK